MRSNRNLTQLVYVSNAASRMDAEALEQMAQRSAARNRRNNITGLLMYGNGHFMQLLEGDLYAINGLYQKIRSDTRHQRINQLMFHPLAQRQFGDWDMKLINLDSQNALDRQRLAELVNQMAGNSLQEFRSNRLRGLALLDDFQHQLASN